MKKLTLAATAVILGVALTGCAPAEETPAPQPSATTEPTNAPEETTPVEEVSEIDQLNADLAEIVERYQSVMPALLFSEDGLSFTVYVDANADNVIDESEAVQIFDIPSGYTFSYDASGENVIGGKYMGDTQIDFSSLEVVAD